MAKREFSHYTTKVDGLGWHWVEEGTGPAIVLLHGIPESWRCWQHQIPTLAKQFRVIVPDMKGYGQSDKPKGDYAASTVAAETLAFLDSIGVENFHIAGHDWGVVIADNIINIAPDRIERYIRCCLSLHEYDARNSLHHQWNGRNPEKASQLMANADAYVRVWFESSCKPECRPEEEEMLEIIKEFSYPGISDVVPYYFSHIRKSIPVDYSKFTMPVLYIHGEHDPRQPIEYARGMEDHIPGLEAVLVVDAGHFITWERPEDVTNGMMWFLHSMLGAGLPIFERSRHYGLPTKPIHQAEGWGVNPGVAKKKVS
jgi:pimeloyl-ACP methyl ester carboxylesterase|tara:strand:- start:48 stop:986 length:939 start_codon:yes stop_codon:yes gene_type:complete